MPTNDDLGPQVTLSLESIRHDLDDVLKYVFRAQTSYDLPSYNDIRLDTEEQQRTVVRYAIHFAARRARALTREIEEDELEFEPFETGEYDRDDNGNIVEAFARRSRKGGGPRGKPVSTAEAFATERGPRNDR